MCLRISRGCKRSWDPSEIIIHDKCCNALISSNFHFTYAQKKMGSLSYGARYLSSSLCGLLAVFMTTQDMFRIFPGYCYVSGGWCGRRQSSVWAQQGLSMHRTFPWSPLFTGCRLRQKLPHGTD